MEYERRVQLLLTASRVLRPRGARASEPLQPRRLPTAALLVLLVYIRGRRWAPVRC